MKRAVLAVCAAVLAPVWASAAHAQAEMQFKQVLNTPKGLNLPKGAKVDILGIELGDTYAEVKTKFEKLLAEANPAKPEASAPRSSGPDTLRLLQQREADRMSGVVPTRPVTEIRRVFRIDIGATPLTIAYVGELQLRREMPGAGGNKIADNVYVTLSAPSSGQQVIGIERNVTYQQDDQPKISQVMASVQDKLGGPPQLFGKIYRFQFDNGRLFAPPGANSLTCRTAHKIDAEDQVPTINTSGTCDVVFEVTFGSGISQDHASSIAFTLSDNERTKLNVGADFAYFQSYVQDLLAKSRGVAPKL